MKYNPKIKFTTNNIEANIMLTDTNKFLFSIKNENKYIVMIWYPPIPAMPIGSMNDKIKKGIIKITW